ncbi:GNAT family N-acetyltransferase [Aquisalimonas sp. APHAB1-3]|uniref:GNAT family N-acetyltransferase n=1 Tax=Aquisalimonas sp. APHAB1-3 TaxID=3402080 RepID=UPI003AB0672C
MEQLAYLVKYRAPMLFRLMEKAARGLTVARFGHRLQQALQQATVHGTVSGEPAVMRSLKVADLEALRGFLAAQPEDHVRHFHPHRFDRASLGAVLASRAFLSYGLFIGDRLVAYALLKVAPTGSAFIGRLVAPSYAGLGLGRFIARYLYWQASLAGLRARSTISRRNSASLRSHEAVATFEVVAELPNEYLLIEFPPVAQDAPVLEVN